VLFITTASEKKAGIISRQKHGREYQLLNKLYVLKIFSLIKFRRVEMKKIFLVTVLLFISINLSAQSGWVLYQSGADSILTDICFVNPNTGWAVGNSTIIKSTNGGLNWVRQNFTAYTTYTVFKTVKFINENTGFVAGSHSVYQDYYANYIFKTTNGGINWNITTAPGSDGTSLYSVFPINKDTIYSANNGIAYAMETMGWVGRSFDGGYSIAGSYLSNCHFYSINFLNYFTGWVSAYYSTDITTRDVSYIYKTTNAGVNWFLQRKDSLSANSSRIFNIMFADQNTGYALGYRKSNNLTRFFKTTNGGTNWISTDYPHNKNFAMFFINQNTGWIGGGTVYDSASIDYTTNGGVNWAHQLKNSNIGVSKLFFINNLTGWGIAGYSSGIIKTTTGGSTFIQNISNEIPDECKLYQNFPNPFNSETNIKFSIKENSFVNLKIYDLRGKEIHSPVNEKLGAGIYSITVNMNNLPSGIYFYRLTAGDKSFTKKFILLK
jgi:photosystem II stability/assembly factor-like uncharacterized protein